MANKQYRLTEAEWIFIQDMRSMDMDELLDIVIALRNEVRELEKKAELIKEREKEGWQEEYQAAQKRINHLRQFEVELRKTWPND
ncbi:MULTISPECIES: hypothetical protein [Brevibacillus]|jgi:hypothetical protein|uniref:Uncharacterized protein n=1 Tax=Brevibacillus formosus TaxID=54913 RepID=A0A220MBG4_9BACL|nr:MULTISPECIES: hypothetical protein [Brevibacillus]ASJ52338.1 hypothetical protein BP422_01560 [Brevibacillus formosus]PSJ67682.1 hypothetical protein C7J99_19180 [Brevibacillus brevis]RED28242.1 hypothetical protein DES34_108104 [Brevibacillus brevis]TQK74188.1 hypothetical protein FB479_102830 [Brevibacillus sp. AG162]VEF90938.1 Uncharacterised protein [Brevibacillus brevis]